MTILNKASRPDEQYAISLLNINYIDLQGSFADDQHVYLHIDKSKVPTPKWTAKDTQIPADKFFSCALFISILHGEYFLMGESLENIEWADDSEYYIEYDITDSNFKINRFAVVIDDEIYDDHGEDYLRAVLDIAEIEGYEETTKLHNIYDKFVSDIENWIPCILANSKYEVVGYTVIDKN